MPGSTEPVSARFQGWCFTLVPGLPLQLLSGIDATVIGIVSPLIIADLTAGSGRYNLAQGAVGMATGIGAALSITAVGFVAQWFGYTTGLLVLAAVAGAAFGYVLVYFEKASLLTKCPVPEAVGRVAGQALVIPRIEARRSVSIASTCKLTSSADAIRGVTAAPRASTQVRPTTPAPAHACPDLRRRGAQGVRSEQHEGLLCGH